MSSAHNVTNPDGRVLDLARSAATAELLHQFVHLTQTGSP
jgi:hypothetical protein